MNRIMVIGVSAGSGKTTFARRLGELTGIEVAHLDRHYWKSGWIESATEEFIAIQREIVERDQWIIEGNYTSTIDIREPHAETVIYLEVPMRVCLYRVIKRRIKYHGRTREDLPPGCPEKIDWAFIKFIVSTYNRRKRKMAERLKRYANEGKTVHYLKSAAQIEEFLSAFQGGKGK